MTQVTEIISPGKQPIARWEVEEYAKDFMVRLMSTDIALKNSQIFAVRDAMVPKI
jgi:hypothetical protein